ncbi:DUF6624 domain-containing protein [uncultured Winogradskyella sp.]|uniref:DUF6624 domain-containing protein n=1 Tax=uncultured Winogradskyella sp. TaxID=395353 RepID=UPI0026105045|nr:DUF6624 domain-containing protein [uncultured Winogradskyella sp.]
MKKSLFAIFLAVTIGLVYSCKNNLKNSTEFQKKDLTTQNLDSITKALEIVYEDDQSLRREYQKIEKEFGWNSQKAKDLWAKQKIFDSINITKVTTIIDKYGWLGIDEVGENGNSAIFLVLQHSDLNTQLEYLPILEKATEKGKATISELAYFKDRVLLRQGKKQIYGTQYEWDDEKKEYYLASVIEPEKLNERRTSVGIPPIEEYYEEYLNREWNLSEYIKRIERIEKSEK